MFTSEAEVQENIWLPRPLRQDNTTTSSSLSKGFLFEKPKFLVAVLFECPISRSCCHPDQLGFLFSEISPHGMHTTLLTSIRRVAARIIFPHLPTLQWEGNFYDDVVYWCSIRVVSLSPVTTKTWGKTKSRKWKNVSYSNISLAAVQLMDQLWYGRQVTKWGEWAPKCRHNALILLINSDKSRTRESN
jgi:hypothetical protein